MKKISVGIVACALVILMAFNAFAGTWKSDANGWWWDNGDGTYPKSQWQWCDSNGDGTAECYYFDANGYCLRNTTTPDGYTVNADGAWVKDGTIQTKNIASASTDDVDESKVAGTYNLYAVKTRLATMLASEIKGSSGYINLKKDGTVKFKINRGKVATSNWSYDNGIVTIGDDTTMDFEYINGVLVYDSEDGAMYFAKSGADTSWIGAITFEQYLKR